MNDTKTDWQGVAFGVTLGVLAAFQYFKLPPVLPLLVRQFGYGRALSGGMMSVYSVAGLSLSVAVGRAFARRGPRGLLAVGFAALALGNLLGLFVAASGPAMLVSRLLEGAGFAVVAVVGGVWTILSASPVNRPIATALWTTWMPTGQLLASLIAIPAARSGQWAPLWTASLALTAAVAAWGHVVVRGARAHLGQSAPAAPGTAAPARFSAPIPLVLAGGLFFLWSAQYIGYMTWLPTYLVEKGHLAPAHAAVLYLAPPVLVIAFNLVAGVLLRRGLALVPLLVCSLAVQALSWALVPLAAGPLAGLGSLVVYAVAAGIVPTCIFALPAALEHAGHPAASGFSALMTGRNLGALAGPLVLGQALAAFGSWDRVALLFAVVTAAALVPALLLRRHTAAPGRRG